MTITITVTGQQPIRQQLQRMTRALAGKDRALTAAINTAGAESTQRNFDAQGRPTPWKDRVIDRQYAAGSRKTKPWPKLDKTGTMRDTTESSWRAKHTWHRRGDTLQKQIRTVPYGLKHQTGAGLPKRQFVRLLPSEQRALAVTLAGIGAAILRGQYHG